MSDGPALSKRPASRCRIMGIVNVTPDSFSDGGSYASQEAAVEHGLRLAADGADIVDVGGESTRPGARRVPAELEYERVVPVVRELAQAGLTVSVDTMRAATAEAALAAGAQIINDVSGGLADPAMVDVVAAAGCRWVLMHWRGHSTDMYAQARYDDVVAEVRDELRARIDAALEGGVAPERLIIDPGLGFAKQAVHDWALLAHLAEVRELGAPVLIGASRKSFVGKVISERAGAVRPPLERDVASAAIALLAAEHGAWGVRVHDVRATADALAVWGAWESASRVGSTSDSFHNAGGVR